MTQIKFWFFISTLSIAFSNDGEGYRFIGNSTQAYYQDLESIFEMSFGPWEIFIVLLIVLLLFGGKKLPEIAKGLGKGIQEFKKASKEVTDEINKTTEEDK